MKDEFLRVERKLNAKEIRENLTEEGKRLELLVKAEIKKLHEKTQELNQSKKNIESLAKIQVKEFKVQELALSQEGQRLQEVVKTTLEHHAQDKDGIFLDKLISQGAEKTTDSIAKVSEKANDSITQSVQITSDKLREALSKPLEKSNQPESPQEGSVQAPVETPPPHDQPPQQELKIGMSQTSSLKKKPINPL